MCIIDTLITKNGKITQFELEDLAKYLSKTTRRLLYEDAKKTTRRLLYEDAKMYIRLEIKAFNNERDMYFDDFLNEDKFFKVMSNVDTRFKNW